MLAPVGRGELAVEMIQTTLADFVAATAPVIVDAVPAAEPQLPWWAQ